MSNQVKYDRRNIVITVCLIVLFITAELISYTVFRDTRDTKLLCRVIARGIFGITIVYNSAFMLLSKKQSFLTKNTTQKQRVFGGVLIGIVGIGMIVTAFLGYGTNGDPRFLWWE